jgi:hypothetical protein
MPMVDAKLQQALETRILNGFKAEFADMAKDNPDAEKFWKKQAKVIAAIAIDLVLFLQTDAQVAPGIPVVTAGSPAAQSGATTSPGKLM